MSEDISKYVDYLIRWIVSEKDIILDPVEELEIIRVIIDSMEEFLAEETCETD